MSTERRVKIKIKMKRIQVSYEAAEAAAFNVQITSSYDRRRLLFPFYVLKAEIVMEARA